jgi:hypothetical protein
MFASKFSYVFVGGKVVPGEFTQECFHPLINKEGNA